MNNRGFTMIEVLVAMVVLAIGLLGMAAMTVLVARGNRGASDLTSATNISQLKIESLKDIDWTTLGTYAGTDPTTQLAQGIPLGAMVQEGSSDASRLNSEGKTCSAVATEIGGGAACGDAAVTARGPYKFTRTFIICQGTDKNPSFSNVSPNPTATVTPGTYPAQKDCGVDASNNGSRTQWIACSDADITTTGGPGNNEKKIKVLTSWKSSDGQCHSVHLDTTVVKLQ